MGLGSFFSKIIPKAVGFIHKLVPKAIEFAPKAIEFGKKTFGFMKKLPGFIDRAETGYRRGKQVVDGLIDQLPDSKFKRKMEEMSDKVDQTATRVTDVVRPIADTAQTIGYRGSRVVDTVERLPWGRAFPQFATASAPQP